MLKSNKFIMELISGYHIVAVVYLHVCTIKGAIAAICSVEYIDVSSLFIPYKSIILDLPDNVWKLGISLILIIFRYSLWLS